MGKCQNAVLPADAAAELLADGDVSTAKRAGGIPALLDVVATPKDIILRKLNRKRNPNLVNLRSRQHDVEIEQLVQLKKQLIQLE